MGLKDRIMRLEGPRGPRRCPECAGRIIEEHHHEDGTVSYPFGKPCGSCGSSPPDGGIGIIVVRRWQEGEAADASDASFP